MPGALLTWLGCEADCFCLVSSLKGSSLAPFAAWLLCASITLGNTSPSSGCFLSAFGSPAFTSYRLLLLGFPCPMTQVPLRRKSLKWLLADIPSPALCPLLGIHSRLAHHVKESYWFLHQSPQSEAIGCSILLGMNFAFSHSIPWRRQWHPTPVLLPGKSHGWRSRVGCSPWGHQESETTERLHFHSCIWRRKWQPTPVFLPGESQGQGSLVGCRLWGRTESDMTEAT